MLDNCNNYDILKILINDANFPPSIICINQLPFGDKHSCKIAIATKVIEIILINLWNIDKNIKQHIFFDE